MNGIENIEKKILDEARLKAEEIIRQAEAEAEKILKEGSEKCKLETTAQSERTVLKLQDIKIKAQQADQMQRRKMIASQRQMLIEEVFERAQQKLLSLSPNEYTALLIKLAGDCMRDNLGGELVFNKKDKELYGQSVVDELNSKIVSGKLAAAKNAVSSAVDDLMEGNIPSYKKIADNFKNEDSKKAVTLSQNTADIIGGVVVRRGKIELNCDIGVMMRILKEELASEVSQKLFPKGA